MVFPRFFTTEKDLGLPFLPRDDLTNTYNGTQNLVETGALCFTLVESFDSCIVLSQQNFAWFKDKNSKRYLETPNVEKFDNKTHQKKN